MKLIILFPNQIFKTVLEFEGKIVLAEHPHFFTRLKFHKQKLILHKASMLSFYEILKKNKKIIEYIDYNIFNLENIIENHKNYEIFFYDPAEKEIYDEILSYKYKYNIKILDSPNFINSRENLVLQFKDKKQILMNNFYIKERKRLKILLNNDDTPLGGSWSFDSNNREALPKDFTNLEKPKEIKSEIITQAKKWVEENFKTNPGNTAYFIWPINHIQAEKQLDDFIKYKLKFFGKYQDAIWQDDPFLYHSLLSATINIGLLNPKEIIAKICQQDNLKNNPIESVEGFIRQIIGWREFMFGIYCVTKNINNKLNQNNKLPKTFWDGSTGIEPIDISIKQLLETGYLHHIYRLMIFGNFMLISNIKPEDVYLWFSELFIDAYNWVMLPNVYGMSQYCTDVKIVTKPYFSSSAYILKMSNFKKNNWCDIWDALFWKFIFDHKELISNNYRLSVMIKIWEKFNNEKKETLLKKAQEYLNSSSQDQYS